MSLTPYPNTSSNGIQPSEVTPDSLPSQITNEGLQNQSQLIPADVPSAPVNLNYIQLMNWFWEEVPYIPDYKPHYGFAFLAIVDCINRNSNKEMWRETAVDYDRLFNKIGCSKTLYYQSLKWLNDQSLIAYKPGRNANCMARFHIGILPIVEVQKRTSDHTSTPNPEVQKRTTNRTSAYTSGGPINKNKPLTLKPQTNATLVVPTFDEFWEAYGKKLDKTKAEQKWNKLSDQDKVDILAVLPGYIAQTSDERYQFRKHPSTFLHNQSWKDEDIGKSLTRPPASPSSKLAPAPRPVPQTDIR